MPVAATQAQVPSAVQDNGSVRARVAVHSAPLAIFEHTNKTNNDVKKVFIFKKVFLYTIEAERDTVYSTLTNRGIIFF
jgi:hypothetical protein